MKTIRLMLRLNKTFSLAGVSKPHRIYTPADRERNRCPAPRPQGAIDELKRALEAQTVSGVFSLTMVV